MKVTVLLRNDHETVKALFEKVKGSNSRNQNGRKELFNEIRREILIHSQMEMEIFYPALAGTASARATELVSEAEREHRRCGEADSRTQFDEFVGQGVRNQAEPAHGRSHPAHRNGRRGNFRRSAEKPPRVPARRAWIGNGRPSQDPEHSRRLKGFSQGSNGLKRRSALRPTPGATSVHSVRSV